MSIANGSNADLNFIHISLIAPGKDDKSEYSEITPIKAGLDYSL